jgi:hypothetical protein
MIALLREMWLLFRYSKKWWMIPLILSLMLLGALLIFAETSALAPFIYTIF